jgi:hypothetical protein
VVAVNDYRDLNRTVARVALTLGIVFAVTAVPSVVFAANTANRVGFAVWLGGSAVLLLLGAVMCGSGE